LNLPDIRRDCVRVTRCSRRVSQLDRWSRRRCRDRCVPMSLLAACGVLQLCHRRELWKGRWV